MHGWNRLTAFLLFVVAIPAAADCSRGGTAPIADLRAGVVAENGSVTVDGIVTGVFLGRNRLGGFYLQDDRQPPSGLFVYAPRLGPGNLRPGQRVQVEGRFVRFHGRPQVSRIDTIRDCGYAGRAEPVAVRLPEDAGRLDALQGVKVRFPDALTVTGNYELGRYGSLRLSSGGRLLRTGAPGSGANAHADRQIVLDDGSYRAEPDPIPYLDAQGTRRLGDTVQGLTGILTHAFGAHRLHPTREPSFIAANPRPEPPPAAPAPLRVSTLNVENYFLTLGQRGARSQAELQRQRGKLAAVVRGLDADVLALTEVENRREALTDLVRQINRGLPQGQRYAAVAHPDSGTDAIQVALLYRPERLDLVMTAADVDPVHNRAPVLGWFRASAGGPLLGVAAVHFKAKVGCPDTGDIDRGQGCWNRLRTNQARSLLEWIDSLRRDGAPVVIAGDINAYAAEDPLDLLRAAGKTNLAGRDLRPSGRYTYVFHGEAGQLDYLLAAPAVAKRVTAAGVWHINADEPPFLGYSGRRPASGPWRSSDHDPVWVDLHWR
ncbi:Endonuclease/exonuclease/phosphatase [Thioalkalivibrio nitratireducens DSM 14787]|uniref:Endonuclease/exonuclease/phosphatase n=1 Tax=Thioalkalivibrio nitratireducens (strain DSM 14787 / UNIQEM 213 / ALEN2) TaxID=1255043 RepID=L0DVG0_THIND|nr:ExeM/NucH family extracellular endonuclease [Thioalkalivibrio nitratireducens]AGA33013.1 Endonuclease/exonuclease/phosphatase [Thioalkalivibrio nitratireducens DSM 14787]